MELCVFAPDDGYAEAIIRGLRASFLTEAHYNQMKNCSTITELKSFLEETDYGPFLMAENPNIQVSVLRSRLKKKLADEFEYIAAQTVGPLAEFLHLIGCKYMIDNVVSIIEGLKIHVDADLLIANADPLGYFPEMKNIKVLEGDDYTGLYRDVLIDTPVGPYFMRFLEDAMEGIENRNIQEIQALFKEMKPEFIRTSLKKMWLEDFHEFCQTKLNPTSKDLMEDLLMFEADFKTIQVVYNSIGNKDFNTAIKIITTRKNLCPNLGYLYPDCQRLLLNAMSLDVIRDYVKGIDNYRDILKDAPDPMKKEDFSVSTKSLDDIMFDEEARRYALAFDQQAHYAVFYSYLKLKEQEIRNIVWLAEMIARKLPKNHSGWKKIIVPFSHMK